MLFHLGFSLLKPLVFHKYIDKGKQKPNHVPIYSCMPTGFCLFVYLFLLLLGFYFGGGGGGDAGGFVNRFVTRTL